MHLRVLGRPPSDDPLAFGQNGQEPFAGGRIGHQHLRHTATAENKPLDNAYLPSTDYLLWHTFGGRDVEPEQTASRTQGSFLNVLSVILDTIHVLI